MKANKEAIEEAQNYIDHEADTSVEDINKRLLHVMITGHELAEAVTNGKISYTDLKKSQ